MPVPVRWRRRAAGSIWLVSWVLVLYAVAAPWRNLGGLVEESIRWMEWFVLLIGVSTGFAVGRLALELAPGRWQGAHLRFLRYLLYPVGLITAITLVTLALIGSRGPVGVVFTGFLAYWAGLDLACGAVPLLDGLPSCPAPSPPDRDPARGDRSEAGWVPPWERY